MSLYLGSKKKKLYLSKILYTPAHKIEVGGWPNDLDTALEFVSAEPFTLSASSPAWDGTVEYSNGNSWTVWDGQEILSGSGNNGQCIYIRGIGNTSFNSISPGLFTLNGNSIECNGNIENLLDYTVVKAGGTPTMANYCYKNMFAGCTSLTTAPDLPATTLAAWCYYSMFRDCTSLTTAPALPATTLANGCYERMFQNCTSLTTAPALPATTLANRCYMYMFYGCTSLTTAPALPATTLANSCYMDMFYGCTKIKLSSSRTGTYTKEYRIPFSSEIEESNHESLIDMFAGTGGTFTGTPEINTTYYLDESNIIV